MPVPWDRWWGEAPTANAMGGKARKATEAATAASKSTGVKVSQTKFSWSPGYHAAFAVKWSDSTNRVSPAVEKLAGAEPGTPADIVHDMLLDKDDAPGLAQFHHDMAESHEWAERFHASCADTHERSADAVNRTSAKEKHTRASNAHSAAADVHGKEKANHQKMEKLYGGGASNQPRDANGRWYKE